jgi:hypothetical protein
MSATEQTPAYTYTAMFWLYTDPGGPDTGQGYLAVPHPAGTTIQPMKQCIFCHVCMIGCRARINTGTHVHTYMHAIIKRSEESAPLHPRQQASRTHTILPTLPYLPTYLPTYLRTRSVTKYLAIKNKRRRRLQRCIHTYIHAHDIHSAVGRHDRSM